MRLPNLVALLLLALLGNPGLGLHGADGAVKGWEGGRADGKLQGRPAAAAAARRHLTAVSSSDPIQGQVAFGTVASRSEFPYVARLLYKNDDWYGCGGTLVRGRAVVTAAHCFFFDGGSPDDPVAAVRIGVVNSLKDRLGVDYQQRRVVKTVIHPLYKPKNEYDSSWDVAVLILDRTVNVTRNPPAVLAAANLPLKPGTRVWAAGWGQTQAADESVLLRKAPLPIVGRPRCIDYLGSLEYDHICAGGAPTRQDTCDGDSGGPLVLKRRPGKRDILVGITSYGPYNIRRLASTL